MPLWQETRDASVYIYIYRYDIYIYVPTFTSTKVRNHLPSLSTFEIRSPTEVRQLQSAAKPHDILDPYRSNTHLCGCSKRLPFLLNVSWRYPFFVGINGLSLGLSFLMARKQHQDPYCFWKAPSRRRNRRVRLINPTKDCRVSTFNEHRNILLSSTESVEDVVWPDRTTKAQEKPWDKRGCLLGVLSINSLGLPTHEFGEAHHERSAETTRNRGSLYYQPKLHALLPGTSLKITIDLYCLIPPNMGNDPWRNTCHKFPTFEAAGSIFRNRFPVSSNVPPCHPASTAMQTQPLSKVRVLLASCWPKNPFEPSQVDTEMPLQMSTLFQRRLNAKKHLGLPAVQKAVKSACPPLWWTRIRSSIQKWFWVGSALMCFAISLRDFLEFPVPRFAISTGFFPAVKMRRANAISFTLAIGPFCMKGKTPREHFI